MKGCGRQASWHDPVTWCGIHRVRWHAAEAPPTCRTDGGADASAVSDSLRLRSIFHAPSESTHFRRDSSEYQTLLDLDHQNAHLARWAMMMMIMISVRL
jgi:hypothetical protein